MGLREKAGEFYKITEAKKNGSSPNQLGGGAEGSSIQGVKRNNE